MLVKDAIRGCSTGQIDGLSKQLLERISNKGYLVKIKHHLINCEGRQNNPYLQLSAYKALVKAVERADTKIIINSCLRTPMQQYMLYRQYRLGICGITCAARPGKSNHQSGTAIDIQDYLFWRSRLQKVGWKWLGAWDKWHFDYKGSSNLNLGSLQVREFQELWNENRPEYKLKVDGQYGQQTATAIANSPVIGFTDDLIFQRGDMSKEVGRLQIMLRGKLGLNTEQLKADCKFGGQTARAVLAYQKLVGLKETGIADKKTLTKLGFI